MRGIKGIPRVETNEHLKLEEDLKRELQEKSMAQKDDEKTKMKREERQKIFEMLNNQMNGRRIRVTKFGKFRAVARSIRAFLWLRKVALFAKVKLRNDKLKDLDDAIMLYTDVTKGWLTQAIKKPILSIVSE